MEVFYDVTNETFFSGAAPDKPAEPLGVVQRGDSAAAAAKLAEAHAALLEAIAPVLANKSVVPEDLGPPPSAMVVGVWSRPDDEYPLGDPSGYMAPTKVYFAPDMSGTVAEACGVDGLTEDEYRKTALQPFDDRSEEEETTGSGIFLANNDYVAMNVYYMYGDWAEEGLLMAERALAKLGNPKPEWLNSDYYDEKVTALL